MATQTTFSEDIPGGFPGMEADGEGSNIITRTLEGATDCEFGRPVYRGTHDKGCDLTVTANELLGRERIDAGGGHLDGKRNPLHPPANAGDSLRVVKGDPVVGAHEAGAISKQANGRILCHTFWRDGLIVIGER